MSPSPPAPEAEPRPADPRAPLLARVFAALDAAGAAWCVLHGHAGLPDRIGRDVDLVVARGLGARRVARLLHDALPDVTLVRCRGPHILLAAADSSTCGPIFLELDVRADAAAGDRVVIEGERVLAGRRPAGAFWTPSPGVQFAWAFARAVLADKLDAQRGAELAALLAAAPDEGAREAERLFGAAAPQALRLAAADDLAALRAERPALAAALAERTARPGRLASAARRALDRIGRLIAPDGLSVAFLGPDGAGKSTAADALAGPRLAPLFSHATSLGFAPPLHRLAGINHGPSREPHKLPPRSLPVSLLRAGWWTLYYVWSYAAVRAATARTGVVTYDRHFVDILVDPKRYRYRGPMWPMRLIWAAIPRPDLVVLLDAPAEQVQARKRELSIDETARQRLAYLELVRPLRIGRVVDASRPLAEVESATAWLVIDAVAARTRRRLGLHRPGRPAPRLPAGMDQAASAAAQGR
jgi:hypothetical protein